MIDSTLLEIFRTFSEQELRQLDKYVRSPIAYYPDNASGVIALFTELLPFAPLFDDENALSREQLAQKLGKTSQYIAKTASGLQAVVRNFISWKYRENAEDTFFEQLTLLRFYQQRGLNQKFESLYNKLEREQANEDTSVNIHKLQRIFKLNAYKSDWMLKQSPSSDLNLKNTLNALDAYFILQKAHYTYNLLFRSLNFPMNTEGYLSVVQDIERYCLNKKNSETQLLLLFYEAILLLTERQDADIVRFQKLLYLQGNELSQHDAHSLHVIERFFVLQKFNQGRYETLPQVFAMYRTHLEKGLLEGNGYLMPTAFANIVRYGCRVGELEWVEQFLKKYEHRLGGTPRPKELFRLYFAYFLMTKGSWKEAENYLEADFEDVTTRVEARCFELMMLYKTQSSLLDYKVESFRKLVRNTIDLPEIRRNGFHSFVLILRKMLNPNLKWNDKRIDKIIAEVKAEPTSEAIWLIVQLQKLKRKKQ